MKTGLEPSRISFSSLAMVNNPFDWAYDLEDMGFGGWEIVSEGQQKLDKHSMAEISSILETTSLALTLHLPFSDLNLASLNEPIWNETLRQMTRCIELASPFARVAVVHPGHLSPLGMQLPDLAWQRNIEGLARLCDFAADFDVTIGVENMVNMDFIFGKQAEEMLGMIELVNRDNLGMTFDVGHANTNAAVPAFLKKTIDKMAHVHIHDNRGKRDDHLPAGKGTIDWPVVIDKLKDIDVRYVLEARTIEAGQESLHFLSSI